MANLLIVEDHPVTQRVLCLTLRSEGYTVAVAANASEAVQRLHEGPVDLVLIDFTLPHGGGMSLLKNLRGDSQFGAVPVIMLMDGVQGDEQRSLAVATGADGFLAKPTTSRELLDTVGRFVYAKT